MKKVIMFYDTETTGTDSKVHGIHQLAGEITTNDEVVHKFDFRINPFKGYQTDLRALKVSNTTPLDLLKYQIEERAFVSFISTLDEFSNPHLGDKIILAGWNSIGFDNLFLKEFFARNSFINPFNTFFHPYSIDVKVLAIQYLINDLHKFEKLNLVSVAYYLGIPIDESKLHTAAYDAYLTRRVYEVITK